MEQRIHALSTGLPKEMKKSGMKRSVVTGIEKERVDEVYLTKDGFKGDDVADKRNHGGPDRAVCFYPLEHYKKNGKKNWVEYCRMPLSEKTLR